MGKKTMMVNNVDVPKTCIRNQTGKTADEIWVTLDVNPIACGHADCFDEWDHQILWMDLDERSIFGHMESEAVPPSARNCVLSQIGSVKKCQSILRSGHKKCGFMQRLKSLRARIKVNSDDATLWEVSDELDEERTKPMLEAEDKCRVRCSGEVPF